MCWYYIKYYNNTCWYYVKILYPNIILYCKNIILYITGKYYKNITSREEQTTVTSIET